MGPIASAWSCWGGFAAQEFGLKGSFANLHLHLQITESQNNLGCKGP